MDTSIIVVIAIAVVFVVVVPTMILRSAKELSRADVDTVPDDVRVIGTEVTSTCPDHTGRPRVFHDDASVEATLPRMQATTRDESMELRLSAQGPELSLVADRTSADHDANSADNADSAAAVDADAAAADEQALPIAVGQSHLITSLTSDDPRRSVHAWVAGEVPNNVRALRPMASTEPMSERASGGSHATSEQPSRGQQTSGPRTRSVEPVPIQSARGARGRLPQKAAGNAHTTGVSDTSVPRGQADEDRSMNVRETTEEETTLRDSLRPLGMMIRGFAVLLLGSLAGIFVSGVLAIFSVVHPALMGVFAGLTVVSVIMVRTLNFRRRDLKRRLRELEQASPRPAKSAARTHPTAGDDRAATTASAPVRRTSTSDSAVSASDSASSASPATQPVRVPAAHRPTSSGIAARIAAAADSNAAVRAAARATARAEQAARGTEAGSPAAARSGDAATRTREEAETGEIPIVHIRNQASVGHTTRQVLLTGPIPIIPDPDDAEATSATDADDAAATSATVDSGAEATAGLPTESTDPAVAVMSDDPAGPDDVAEATTAPTPSHLGADLDLDTGTTSAAAAGPTTGDAAEVTDPFMQRLRAQGGWLPTPLPVPSYVDSPEAEQAPAQSAPADAASYTIETRTREEIAARFAAELGYRPELSDHSREDGPLGHGRTAIRTTKAPELGAIDDVLARRRA